MQLVRAKSQGKGLWYMKSRIVEMEFSTLSGQFVSNLVLKSQKSQGIVLRQITSSSRLKQLSAAKDEKQVFA